jgi:hypothetical protein
MRRQRYKEVPALVRFLVQTEESIAAQTRQADSMSRPQARKQDNEESIAT